MTIASDSASAACAGELQTAASDPTAPLDPPWPRPAYAWFVVFVLLLAYTNAYIDRTILSLLIEPMRRDFAISDTQVSLLAGLAFSVFYCIMGIPLARLADRSNRVRLILIGMSFWGLMTALCGTARGFWSLFLYRIGVGVGEAALSPAAYSLLADYFPRHKLGRAISVYSMGLYLGAGLAMMIGGVVVKMVSNSPPTTLPFFGEVHAWQLTYLYVAALGVPIIALMLLVREPLRRGLASATASTASQSNWPALRAFLAENRVSVIGSIAGYTLFGIAIATYLVWTPSYFIRTWQWDASTAGWVYGLILLTAGSGGAVAGGYAADRFTRAGRDDGPLLSGIIAAWAPVPLVILMPFLPSASLAVANLVFISFFIGMNSGLPAATLGTITPNALRAQLVAIYLFVANLVANTLGPTLVGLLNDYVFRDPQALRYSMAAVAAVALSLSGATLYGARAAYRVSVMGTQTRC
jgi:MFS family permease